jgi:hypothetical protein
MITMEFEELQKIWDSQNNTPLYAIDENALHNRILTKKRQTGHITNVSEWLSIVVNLCSGGFVLAINYSSTRPGLAMYLLAAWMVLVSLYALTSRIRRITREHQFNRTLKEDLNHAIAMATYQVRLSRLMRWNMVPIAALCLIGMWEAEKNGWIFLLTLGFFAMAYYASGWEHSIYQGKKKELEVLKAKLEAQQ